ncbi:hypothetical protein [Rhodobacter maris]|uniref:Uncharacterized protein n=1 Tax=Rhodobacter maris TaxID=446682 RepID=A0A285S301_9RHOB|nr:hypothetical protein [Rhodobacter maris]SOB99286.1 hypothetical protein SAMN05877831_102144 [Rhodobacter maris]
MIRKTMIATTTAVMLASSALVGPALANTTPVHEVDVETDITAIANPKAADYWGRISDDLQSAIAARLAENDQLAPQGAVLDVDIDELALANTFEKVTSDEDAVLVGTVRVLNRDDRSPIDNYTVTVNTAAAHAFDKEGKLKEGAYFDSPAYYVAMVNAFANGVVSRLE